MALREASMVRPALEASGPRRAPMVNLALAVATANLAVNTDRTAVVTMATATPEALEALEAMASLAEPAAMVSPVVEADWALAVPLREANTALPVPEADWALEPTMALVLDLVALA